MPESLMKLEDITAAVAKEIFTPARAVALLETPEGRAVVARAINEKIEELDSRHKSELAEEKKLRTASDEAAAELRAKFEKFERRSTYDRDYGFHRGADGTLKPSVSRETAEWLVKMIRALHAKDGAVINELRALSSGVLSEGGVFLPVEVSKEIIRLIPETGLYPRIARDVPMGAGTLNIGAVVGGMHAYWPDENTLITPSFPGFDKLVLVLKQLAAYIPVPLSLIEDSVIDFGQLIADLVRECLALEIDRVGIVGKSALNGGTDPFDGLINSAGINVMLMTGTFESGVDLDMALDMQTVVPDGSGVVAGATGQAAISSPSYILSPSVFNWLRKQKTSTGEYIYQRPSDSLPGLLWNQPYHLSYRMPAFTTAASPSTRFMLYGDWKRFAFYGHRDQISIATSDVAGEAFQRVQLAIRGITRVGFASFGPAIAVLETAP